MEESGFYRYKVSYTRGVFICGYCGREFPTHYRVTKGEFRKQFARRYVAGINNFERHLRSCKKEKE